MTLLEIMIVLAILALVMGLVVGPRVIELFTKAKGDITQLKVKKYAHEAYPQWVMSAGKQCPDKLEDLNPYMNSHKGGIDEWGHPLEMLCGTSLPPHVHGFAVRSLGKDGQPNTADDVTSWED